MVPGTTWAQQIMMLVQVEADLSFFEGKHISKLVPFLECPDIPDTGLVNDMVWYILFIHG